MDQLDSTGQVFPGFQEMEEETLRRIQNLPQTLFPSQSQVQVQEESEESEEEEED